MILVNSLSNKRQVIFVGDIPDHHCSSSTSLKLINIDIIKVSFFGFLSSSLGSGMVLIVVGVSVGSVGLGRRSGLASVIGRSGIGDWLLAHALVHHVEIVIEILWNNEKLLEHIRTRGDVEVLVDEGLRSSGTKGAEIVVGEGVLQEIIAASEGQVVGASVRVVATSVSSVEAHAALVQVNRHSLLLLLLLLGRNHGHS